MHSRVAISIKYSAPASASACMRPTLGENLGEALQAVYERISTQGKSRVVYFVVYTDKCA